MPLEGITAFYQSRFADACRTGDCATLPGVSPERQRLYGELVASNLRNTLERAFPILKSDLTPEEWLALTQDFIVTQAIKDPELWKLAGQFNQYLKISAWPERLNRPYLLDLADFEWIEIEVDMMPDVDHPPHRSDGHLLNNLLVMNREYRVLYLHYPVFRAPPSQLRELAGDYCLLVYRHPQTLQVEFLELDSVSAYILQLLNTFNVTGREALEAFTAPAEAEARAALFQAGYDFIKFLHREGLILGFQFPNDFKGDNHESAD